MKRALDLLLYSTSNSDLCQKMEILRAKMKHLTAREADVRMEIENAEIQPGKRRREEVVNWLTTVELKKIVVQIMEKEVQPQGLMSSNSLLRDRIERVTKDVQELIQDGRFPSGLVLDDYKSRALPFPTKGLVGEMFQKNIETILTWLKDPVPFLISVHGMGGVGKTTLLKYIHNHLLEESDLGWRVSWVTVSQDCSLYMLQHKIAHAIAGKNDLDEDEERRAAELHTMLGKMGKAVIILDDVWETFMLDKVGIPLGENSCKIIVSTRSLEVCRKMGSENFIVKVKPLSISEAWMLFVDKLQNYEKLATEVKQIAALVANECGCLPLAIITIAVSMRGIYNRPEWLNALDELKNPSRRQHGSEDEVFYKLKFSYDRLNDEMMKHCFLTCVLYPEDYPIERQELIDLWIAEGLLNGIESRHKQLNQGHTILNKLENLCLLEPTDGWYNKQCVKMHDLIRDMGIKITQTHPHFMVKPSLLLKEVPRQDQWSEDLLKVSLRDNEITEIPCDVSPMCSKLSVMMLCRNPLKGIPESFFMHMMALTVLDLSYTDIERLPNSIQNLKNLRALFLQGCAKLTYVPSLAKLTKLMVLDLGFARAPEGMENLRCLQKVNCSWNISDLTYFYRLGEHRQFSELSCYEFELFAESNCLEPDYFKMMCNDDYDKKLMISGGGKEFGHGVCAPFLPRAIQFLMIQNCDIKGRECTLGNMLPSLGRATELRSLDISSCRGLEYISAATQEVHSIFPRLDTLECLKLFELPDMEGVIKFSRGSETPLLPQSPRLAGAFTHLKELTVQECHKLKVVFPLNLLQHQACLLNLEKIQVIICNEVEDIFESPSNSSISFNNLILKLPKLRDLNLWALPKFRNIYRGLLCTPLRVISSVPKRGPNLSFHRGPCLFWDDSLSTVASMSTPAWWDALYRDYPEDARIITSWIRSDRDPLLRSWVKWLDSVQQTGTCDDDVNGQDKKRSP